MLAKFLLAITIAWLDPRVSEPRIFAVLRAPGPCSANVKRETVFIGIGTTWIDRKTELGQAYCYELKIVGAQVYAVNELPLIDRTETGALGVYPPSAPMVQSK